MKIFALATLLIAGCSFNPTEGDFGVVKIVPEQDSCEVLVEKHDTDGQVETHSEMRPCDGEGHDVEFFGRNWFRAAPAGEP